MDLDTFIITVFCIIDDMTKDICSSVRLRQRGPAPTLADSEALTIEVVGEYLGMGQDSAIFDHFLRHHSELFPALRRITRTSFVRQSANLCGLKSLKHASRDPHPQRSMALRRIRRRIETVFGQLVDRYGIKRVWARDMWHLSSRLLRKTLSHTIAVMLNQLQGNPPLQISKLVV